MRRCGLLWRRPACLEVAKSALTLSKMDAPTPHSRRQETLAQLKRYSGAFSFDTSDLRDLDPSECGICRHGSIDGCAGCPLSFCSSLQALLLILPAKGCRLPMLPCLRHCLPTELRQLVEEVFAQESERVRVAVLQHLIDDCSTRLAAALLSIGECCHSCGRVVRTPRWAV